MHVGTLGKPTYPHNLKITLIINKNAYLAFGIQVDYSARSSLEERRGSAFQVQISVGARTTHPHFYDPETCIDLSSEVGGGG